MGGGGKRRLELRDFGEKRTVCVCVFVCVLEGLLQEFG